TVYRDLPVSLPGGAAVTAARRAGVGRGVPGQPWCAAAPTQRRGTDNEDHRQRRTPAGAGRGGPDPAGRHPVGTPPTPVVPAQTLVQRGQTRRRGQLDGVRRGEIVMTLDLLVKNVRVVRPDRAEAERVDIGVVDGRF